MIARIFTGLIGLALVAAGIVLSVACGLAILGVFIPGHLWSVDQTAWFLKDSLEALIAAPVLAYAACRLGAALLSGSWDHLASTRKHIPAERLQQNTFRSGARPQSYQAQENA